MGKHQFSWTLWRRLLDRHIPRVAPGRHHPIWELVTP